MIDGSSPSPSTAPLAQFRRGFSLVSRRVRVYLWGVVHVRDLVAAVASSERRGCGGNAWALVGFGVKFGGRFC